MTRAALAGCLAVVAACVQAEPFRCEGPADCRRGGDQGVCEPTGFCSFADDGCDSGRSYGELAGDDLGGTCVTCVAELAGGDHHVCARTQAGAIECWGDSSYGQIGDGGTDEHLLPVPIDETDEGASLGPAVSIAAGTKHTCAVLESGALYCWGANDYGQLGIADLEPRTRPALAPDATGLVQVGAGLTHTCVVDGDAAMSCFGDNRASELGVDQDDLASSVAPVTVLEGGVARGAVGPGAFHSCALTGEGAVLCWGGNSHGQLGNGTRENSDVPTTALPSGAALTLATANHGSCAVLVDRTVACWGDNELGQLGDGTRELRDEPAPVAGLTGATQVVLGNDHACARLDDGSVWCWGSNTLGQLGAAGEVETEPVKLVDAGAVLVAAAASTTCVLEVSGLVSCWGQGSSGERGDGREEDSADPGAVGLSCR